MIIIRWFSRFYPNVHFKTNNRSIIKPMGESWSFQGVEASYNHHPRKFAEKGGKPKTPAKEEVVPIKMPGFVHPSTTNEEGYFTQKAKQQIEELKRKIDKPTMNNPEKED